jgi:hypothetical protein
LFFIILFFTTRPLSNSGYPFQLLFLIFSAFSAVAKTLSFFVKFSAFSAATDNYSFFDFPRFPQ